MEQKKKVKVRLEKKQRKQQKEKKEMKKIEEENWNL